MTLIVTPYLSGVVHWKTDLRLENCFSFESKHLWNNQSDQCSIQKNMCSCSLKFHCFPVLLCQRADEADRRQYADSISRLFIHHRDKEYRYWTMVNTILNHLHKTTPWWLSRIEQPCTCLIIVYLACIRTFNFVKFHHTRMKTPDCTITQ